MRIPLRIQAILRVLGVIVALSSLSKLPSVAIALALDEGTAGVFFGSFLVSLIRK